MRVDKREDARPPKMQVGTRVFEAWENDRIDVVVFHDWESDWRAVRDICNEHLKGRSLPWCRGRLVSSLHGSVRDQTSVSSPSRRYPACFSIPASHIITRIGSNRGRRKHKRQCQHGKHVVSPVRGATRHVRYLATRLSFPSRTKDSLTFSGRKPGREPPPSGAEMWVCGARCLLSRHQPAPGSCLLRGPRTGLGRPQGTRPQDPRGTSRGTQGSSNPGQCNAGGRAGHAQRNPRAQRLSGRIPDVEPHSSIRRARPCPDPAGVGPLPALAGKMSCNVPAMPPGHSHSCDTLHRPWASIAPVMHPLDRNATMDIRHWPRLAGNV